MALNANARPPALVGWPNGYEAQIEIRLEAVAGGGNVTNALLPMIITNPDLRTAFDPTDPDGNPIGYGGSVAQQRA